MLASWYTGIVVHTGSMVYTSILVYTGVVAHIAANAAAAVVYTGAVVYTSIVLYARTVKRVLTRAMFEPCGWTTRVLCFTLRKPIVLPLLEERREREGL